MQMLLKLVRRNEKPVFVSNKQEFLSLWSVAHAWKNLPSDSTDPANIPASIQADIDSLMLAFLRDEISLRRSNGYRVLGHTFLQTFFWLDGDFERIAAQLYRKVSPDKIFLDDLYVRRSEFLRWCEGEYRSPPECWDPHPTKTDDKLQEENIDDAEGSGWLGQLTERRRKIVACLEVAKHIWHENQNFSYEDVYNHPLLAKAGLRNVFSFESFKKWSRSIAPDEAKRGGRRVQSTA